MLPRLMLTLKLTQKWWDMLQALENYGTSIVQYFPSLYSLLIVYNLFFFSVVKSKEDDGWYRGACVQLCGDEFEIFLVDYGFREVLPRDRIKMMDPSLMKTVSYLESMYSFLCVLLKRIFVFRYF